MSYDVKELQAALVKRGYDLGNTGPNGDGVDGELGPLTEMRISEFKTSIGYQARPYVGPLTWKALTGKELKTSVSPKGDAPTGLPWINEISKYLGQHEARDFSSLSKWLRSDGGTVGDPRKIPWCGDAVQTAIRLALRNEAFPGKVGANPYLARNWLDFGVKCSVQYGAVAVFWRGSKKGFSGHVGFVVGVSKDGKLLRIRGGNQSNRVSDTWISKDRLLGCRKPSTWPHVLPSAPVMTSRGAVISTNEA